jgi:tetratricopeptide (TPR) repeat protein
MADSHLTREILRAVVHGRLSFQAMAQIGFSHLTSVCEHCREEIEAFQKEEAGGSGARYHRTFEILPALLDEGLLQLAREREQSDRDLKALLALPRQEREGRIRRARERFRSPLLIRMLLDESRARLPGEAAEAAHLADLARVVVQRNPAMREAFDLLALASAEKANACRALSDLNLAQEIFGHVDLLVTEHGVTDSWVLARVAELKASLFKDRRRFSEAKELLAFALLHYKLANDPQRIGRVLLSAASLSFHSGDTDQAIEGIRSFLQEFPIETKSHLYLCARYNLARYLVEVGGFEEASEILETDQALFQSSPEPWTQLRVAWLRGKIAARCGDSTTAERTFHEVRDGFIAQGIGYDAAMVCLEDLAPLYLRQGRTADVKQLAEEMYPIFHAQDVHREALAALVIFQEAARREELTVQKVRDIATYLRDARGNSGLRYRPG